MIDINGVHRCTRYVLTEVAAGRQEDARDARDLATMQVLVAIRDRNAGYASDLASAALELWSVEIDCAWNRCSRDHAC